MERPEKVERKFHKPDTEMLEQAEVMQANFTTDQPDFTDQFPDMDTPFETDFETAITTADALPDDEAVVDDQQLETQDVEELMETARTLVQILFLIVSRAFPKDAAILDVFGKKRYEKARKNQLKMIELLEVAYKAATNPLYNAAIIAKGFSATQIAQLNTLENDLQEENKTQEVAKSGRPVKTQTRVQALNVVWDFMVLISDASKVIYKDNYAKRKQYLLYPSQGSDSPLEYTGPINSGEALNVLNNSIPEYVTGITVRVKNTTSNPAIGPLYFYTAFGPNDGWDGQGPQLTPGQETTITLDAGYFRPYFNVQNPGPNEQSWEVEILP